MNKLIYLDNAATTKTAPEVLEAMLPYFSEYYGNPSSIYDFGQKSKEAVTRGRQQIADVLNAKKEEIYFTAGGSEADNWHSRQPLKHINPKEIISSQPRSSIMQSCTPVNILRRKEEQRSPISM